MLMFRLRTRLNLFFVLIVTLAGCASVAQQDRAVLEKLNLDSVQLSRSLVEDATLVTLSVQLEPGVSFTLQDEEWIWARFEKQVFPVFTEAVADQVYLRSIVAIPYLTQLGPRKVELLVKSGEQWRVLKELPIEVKGSQYRSEKLRVDPSRVSPPAEAMDRIKAERKEVKALYKQVQRTKFWKGPFELPIKSKITSPFGSKRIFNGKMKSFHSGLDLRAPVGTPIRAPEAGRVLLAKNLYYSGNAVLLDHGYGLKSMYAHMSKVHVKPGQIVKKGDVLGLAGMTGRVNGPHLHWSAIVMSERIKPLELTRNLE